LLAGIAILGILFVHGTLGAQLGEEFGIHVTAAKELPRNKLSILWGGQHDIGVNLSQK
jgi:hypothetical protein